MQMELTLTVETVEKKKITRKRRVNLSKAGERQAPLPLALPEEMRLPMPALTIEEFDLLPARPFWLPAYRATEAAIDAIPMALETWWPWIRDTASRYVLKMSENGRGIRPGVDADDIAAVMVKYFRGAIVVCDPNKINPRRAALAYCRAKLANRSAERDALPEYRAYRADAVAYSIDDINPSTGLPMGDNLIDKGLGSDVLVDRMEQMKEIIPAMIKRGQKKEAAVICQVLGIKWPRLKEPEARVGEPALRDALEAARDTAARLAGDDRARSLARKAGTSGKAVRLAKAAGLIG